MKLAMICCVFGLLVGLTGCHREHDRVGDAPRTVSVSPVAGWKDVVTSGIALSFPTDWKLLDLTTTSIENGADKVFGSDPKYAALRSQASAAAKQGVIKVIAFDTSTLGSGFGTNCTVAVVDGQGQATLEQEADATVLQVAPIVAKGTQPKLTYVSLKSGRFALIRSEITSADPSIPALLSLAYLNVKNSRLVVISFTTPRTAEAHIQTIADQVMNTVRIGK